MKEIDKDKDQEKYLYYNDKKYYINEITEMNAFDYINHFKQGQ